MNETFQNAPLVEIVAELRWQMPQLSAVDASGNTMQLPVTPFDNAVEAFFHRVTAAVGKHGFTRLEQLAPVGMPVLLPQMTYRYRRADELPVLAQVGPGMFSVNALPPYKSWAEFRPWLENGIEALLDAFGEQKLPLVASLRYIDAFRHDLTGERDARAFATDVLGFRLELPQSLRTHVTDERTVRAAFQIALPIKGMQMAITLSDGQLGGQQAVLMNTDVRIDGFLDADKNRILAALDSARALVHEIFVDITRPIRDKMQPADATGGV